jgi:uncharacterized protein (DUF58 family)
LYLAGATNDSAPAYAFASALLGILLAAYVLSRLAASGLAITWTRAPQRAQAGQESEITIEVTNSALLVKPRARLTGRAVAISFPGEDEELALRLSPIARGVSGLAELPLVLPWRGRWEIRDLRLEGSDPLGLYDRQEVPAASIPVITTPAFWSALPVPYTALLTPSVRQRLANLRPDQGEYRSLREYVPGDDLRRIHWRATAHRARLMVKEYERPRDLQTQVWVAAVSAGQEMDEGGELALSVAATLAHAFVTAGLPTVLRAPGLPTPAQGPGRGAFFWRELLAALGELRYSTEDEAEGGAIRWSRDLSPGSSLHIVSNSRHALAVMRASLGAGESVPALFTGPERETPPWATYVAGFGDIPMALSRAASATQTKQAAYA